MNLFVDEEGYLRNEEGRAFYKISQEEAPKQTHYAKHTYKKYRTYNKHVEEYKAREREQEKRQALADISLRDDISERPRMEREKAMISIEDVIFTLFDKRKHTKFPDFTKENFSKRIFEAERDQYNQYTKISSLMQSREKLFKYQDPDHFKKITDDLSSHQDPDEYRRYADATFAETLWDVHFSRDTDDITDTFTQK